MMEQKNYTLEECRAFNQKQLEITTAFIKCNFANAACKELVLPDGDHPWIILHSVIYQFYKREYEIAQAIDMARCEMNQAKKIREVAKERDDLYWKMENEIVDLRQKNKKLKAELSQSEKMAQEQPIALQELIDVYGIDGLIDGAGDVLDGLITAAEYSGSAGLLDPMRYTRALQGFFMKLEKELAL